ncbi:MAG: hypothetical protein FWG05_05375, partial [Kiritimatiellaeota bacterium]|nr:hypothetical protein [Kiritimatiellota bacterium]
MLYAVAQSFAQTQYTAIPYSSAMVASAQTTYQTRLPLYAINGAGLDGNDCHGTDQNTTMWMGANTPNAFAEWFRVDLGTEYNLGAVKIWNFNMASYESRGINLVEIYTAPETSDTTVTGAINLANLSGWTFVTSENVPKASGGDAYAGNPLIEWEPRTARWVLFRIRSLQAGNDGYGGISELRFYAESGSPHFVMLDSVNVTYATTLDFGGSLETDTVAELFACYGETNGVKNLDAWEYAVSYGDYPAGVYSETLSGLGADKGYWFNVAITNGIADAWAAPEPVTFITGEVEIGAPQDFYKTQNAALVFRRPVGTTNVPLTIAYSVGGTAEPGVHYASLPGSVTFAEDEYEVIQAVTPINISYGGDKSVEIALQNGNFVYNATAANVVFNILDNEIGGGVTVWTGLGDDNSWTNAANWSAGIPGAADTAVFNDTAVPATVSLDENQTVYKLKFDTAGAYVIGSAGDQTAGNLLTLTEIERTDDSRG